MTAQTLRKTTLRAKDLSCPSCVSKIETALNAATGVSTAEVKFNSGRIVVQHDADIITADGLIDVVKSAGYVAEKSAF